MTTRWRKRLNDLRQLIIQADKTYFEPDLFRLNINNAIQTSRTITFIIQKEKSKIPDYDAWYKAHVLDAMAGDKIMSWLKDARNVIEKEGDLEVNSYWRAYHLYSYTNAGAEIKSTGPGSLFIKLHSLRKFVKDQLPPGIFKDSALAIDRKWIANTLPEYELIDAVVYGYRKLAQIVDKLDVHMGETPQSNVTSPFDYLYISQTRRAFLKLLDSKFSYLTADIFSDKPTEAIRTKFLSIQEHTRSKFFEPGHKLHDNIKDLAAFASELLKRDGYHIPVCFLFTESPPGCQNNSSKI